jgi:hypothetical protein
MVNCPFPLACKSHGCDLTCEKMDKTLNDVIAREADTDLKPSARITASAPAGRKDDGGKLDVTLFFNDLPHAIEGVTEVLQWAITKKQPVPYVRGSWQQVPQFQQRYQSAQLRHELNRAKAGHAQVQSTAEPLDAETGLMELAHIATDAMFRLEMAMRKRKGLPVPEGA